MRKLIPGHIITPSSREAALPSDSMNLQIPLILLSLAAATFFGSQIGAAYQGEATMRWQLTNADNQIENVQKAEAQMTELIKQREELVKQATQIQTEYTNLLNSVIDLAKTDNDAREVVAKWNIQRSEPAKPAAGSTEPSSAPSSPGKVDAPPEGGVSGAAPSTP
jgi:hypothetical protein